ncbi:MAG: hypothetical protein PHU85_12885 [Phycisphaerae bacterium]|nr:hypothetical protein [Phycisphaerae bacterium]
MRKLLVAGLVSVLSLGVTGAAMARGHHGGAGNGKAAATAQVDKGGKFQERLARLNLTGDQKKKVDAIMAKAKTDAAAATDRATKRAVWRIARKDIVQNVLTADQRAELRKNHAAHANKAAGAGHHKHATPTGATTPSTGGGLKT